MTLPLRVEYVGLTPPSLRRDRGGMEGEGGIPYQWDADEVSPSLGVAEHGSPPL
jgi:hypothetical protein